MNPNPILFFSYSPYRDMATSNPDYYWERIKDIYKFGFGSIALLFVSGLLFNNSGVFVFFAFLFWIALVVAPFAFIYYAYKDKQALAAYHSDVNERHWLTISLFMWLSSGLYALVYTYTRATRYDPVGSGGTETGTQKLLTAGQSVIKRFDDGDGETSSAGQSPSTTTATATSSSTSGSTARLTSTDSSTSGSSSSSGASSSASQSSGPADPSATSDSGSDTNLYTGGDDDDDGSETTEVYDPNTGTDPSDAEGSASQTSSGESSSASQFCSHCGSDLRPYGSPEFCPECGTEAP